MYKPENTSVNSALYNYKRITNPCFVCHYIPRTPNVLTKYPLKE